MAFSSCLDRVDPQPLKNTLLMKPGPLAGRHRCWGIEPCDLSSQGVGCNNLGLEWTADRAVAVLAV